MIKTLQTGRHRGNLPQHNKDHIWQTHTANITLKGEKPKAFPLRSGTRQGYLLLPLLFYIVLEILSTAIREEKEIKGIKIGKEEVKLPLFAGDLILYSKTLMTLPENCQNTSMNLGMLDDTKLIHRNWLHFHILKMKDKKEKQEKPSHLPLHQKE